MTRTPRQARGLSVQHMDPEWDEAESSQSKLGNKVLHEFKQIKIKATHDKLMNLLDLAKSNGSDN